MTRGVVAAIAIAAASPGGTALGHADRADDAAWSACEEATLAQSCAYSDHHDTVYRGTCRLMVDTLLCVRNRPLERHVDPDS